MQTYAEINKLSGAEVLAIVKAGKRNASYANAVKVVAHRVNGGSTRPAMVAAVNLIAKRAKVTTPKAKAVKAVAVKVEDPALVARRNARKAAADIAAVLAAANGGKGYVGFKIKAERALLAAL